MRSHLDTHVAALLTAQRRQLLEVTSLRSFDTWRDRLVGIDKQSDDESISALGTMVSILADRDESARQHAVACIAEWCRLVAATLRRLQDNGRLRGDADPEQLATGLIAGAQGGYVRAQASRNPALMAIAIDMALARIRSFAGEDP